MAVVVVVVGVHEFLVVADVATWHAPNWLPAERVLVIVVIVAIDFAISVVRASFLPEWWPWWPTIQTTLHLFH